MAVLVVVVVVVLNLLQHSRGLYFHQVESVLPLQSLKWLYHVVSKCPSTIVKCENGSETGHYKAQVHFYRARPDTLM